MKIVSVASSFVVLIAAASCGVGVADVGSDHPASQGDRLTLAQLPNGGGEAPPAEGGGNTDPNGAPNSDPNGGAGGGGGYQPVCSEVQQQACAPRGPNTNSGETNAWRVVRCDVGAVAPASCYLLQPGDAADWYCCP